MMMVFFWVAIILFKDHNIWIETVAPLSSFMLTFIVSAVFSYVTEGKARRQLRNAFNRYLSPVVIDEIIKNKDTLALGGKKIVGTVFFSDVKDFTSISEKLDPSALVFLMNAYFGLTSEVILANGGLLDKYIGDAVMAIFGAPLSMEDHAKRACTSALEIRKIVHTEWEKAHNQYPPMITRMGIHTGAMIVGNIGSEKRSDYTALGDTVNLASRLEGINKFFGTEIILSGATNELVQGEYTTRRLDFLRVKGKEEPIVIYELLDRHDKITDSQKTLLDAFDKALTLYRNRYFIQAIRMFEAIVNKNPSDGPSHEYINRCRAFNISPPPDNWDGVFSMSMK